MRVKSSGAENRFEVALLTGSERLGVRLSTGAAGRLLKHWHLLVRWNRKINLTAVTDPELAAEALYLDSALVVEWLEKSRTVHDVGSGAGFPGLVIKALRPGLSVRLTEARRRRASFLRRAASAMGLLDGLQIECRRLGWEHGQSLRSQEVLSRATFPPREWLRQGAGLVEPGGRLWLYLGHHLAGEEVSRGQLPGAPEGFTREQVHRYQLPFSGRKRLLVSYRSLATV